MRPIWILLCGLLITSSSIAQNSPGKPKSSSKTPTSQRPSNEAMKAQMQEAIKELREQIAEMERDIAKAKANNEDGETIRQMESQLASTKKMLASMEKINPGGPPTVDLPEIKTVLPASHSPQILPIRLKPPVVYPTKDQAKDTLFWFVGKKSDDSTLLTAERLVVRYSAGRNLLIFQPDLRRDSPMYIKLAFGLAQTPRVKNDFVLGVDAIPNIFFLYPQIQVAYDEYSLQADRYYSMAKNSLPLPPIDNLFGQSDFDTWERELLQMQVELEQLIASMPLGTITDAWVGSNLPPARPVNVCACDDAERKAFEKKLETWYYNFFNDENQLKNHIYKMESHYQWCLQNGLRRSIPDWRRKIFEGQRLMFSRVTAKVGKIAEIHHFLQNIYTEEGLAIATLKLKNDLEQLSKIVDDMPQVKQDAQSWIRDITKMFETDKYFKDTINSFRLQHEYIKLFDLGLYVSHESSKAIFTNQYLTQDEMAKKWIDYLESYNTFSLKMEMKFLVHDLDTDGKTAMWANADLSSDEVFVKLGQFSCKWQLYLQDANYSDKSAEEGTLYIPIAITKGIKDNVEDKLDPFEYSGPAYLKMPFPVVRINFCNQSPDSLIMTIFRYEDEELKQYPKSDFAHEYSTDLLAYGAKMFLGIDKTKAHSADMTNIAADMINLANTNQMQGSPTGHPKLDRMKSNFNMEKKKQDLRAQLSEVSQTAESVIIFESRTGDPKLILKNHPLATNADPDKKLARVLINGFVQVTCKHECSRFGCN
jgi:hypothetical protein